MPAYRTSVLHSLVKVEEDYRKFTVSPLGGDEGNKHIHLVSLLDKLTLKWVALVKIDFTGNLAERELSF